MSSGLPNNIEGRWYKDGVEITATVTQINGTSQFDRSGTATNDNAAAGQIGEFVSSVILDASAVNINDITATDLTSISLTAGDWDVWGNLNFEGTAMTNIVGWISSTSATLPDTAYLSIVNLVGLGTANAAFCVPQRRFSLSGTTTIYISGYQDGTGAGLLNGAIYARRIR
jgi:hypothetical protein